MASGVACLSLGSDTGGSVRIPAAWCGVASIKPSYGLLSRHGLIPLVNSLDVPGLLGRTVADLAAYLQLLAGRDPQDSTSRDFQIKEEKQGQQLDRGLRIGVPQEYVCEGMAQEVIQALSDACHGMQEEGCSVVPVSLPHTELAVPCYSVLNPCEVASNMARYDGLQFGLRGDRETSTEELFADGRATGFNEVVRGRILAGNYFLLKKHYADYFLQALKIRRLVQQDFLACWADNIDFLITPVTLTDAPSYEDYMQVDNRTHTARQDYCTQPVNLAGLPAVTVPVCLSARSLPLAVQLIGPYGSDNRLLQVAARLEQRLAFPRLVITE